MLNIPAKTVYIDSEIYRKDNCRKRLERMLPNIRCNDIRDYGNAVRKKVSGTPRMWNELRNIIVDMRPNNYICNCGSMSAPGGELYHQLHAAK